jgi:hypothetical protein
VDGHPRVKIRATASGCILQKHISAYTDETPFEVGTGNWERTVTRSRRITSPVRGSRAPPFTCTASPFLNSSLDVLGWLSNAPAEPPTGSSTDVPRRSHKTSTSASASRSFRRTTTITCAVHRRQGPCLGHHTSSAGRQFTSLLLCRPTPFGQTSAPTRIQTRFTWRCCCFCSIQRDRPREIRSCGVHDYSLPTVLATNLRSQHLLCRRYPVQLPTWALYHRALYLDDPEPRTTSASLPPFVRHCYALLSHEDPPPPPPPHSTAYTRRHD